MNSSASSLNTISETHNSVVDLISVSRPSISISRIGQVLITFISRGFFARSAQVLSMFFPVFPSLYLFNEFDIIGSNLRRLSIAIIISFGRTIFPLSKSLRIVSGIPFAGLRKMVSFRLKHFPCYSRPHQNQGLFR